MTPYYEGPGVRLYHGDVFDVLDVAGPFDLLLSDPPYSSGGQFRGDRMRSTLAKYSDGTESRLPEFTGDSRDQRGFLAWVSMWAGCARRQAPMTADLLVFTDWRQAPTLTDAIQAGGWVWSGLGAWDKVHGRPQPGHFRHTAEFVVHGTNGDASGREYHPPQVYQAPAVTPTARRHLAEKPEALAAWLVPFSGEGDVVFDPFMGCGALLTGARAMGRQVVGGDLDESWCEVAADALRQGVFDFKAPAT